MGSDSYSDESTTSTMGDLSGNRVYLSVVKALQGAVLGVYITTIFIISVPLVSFSATKDNPGDKPGAQQDSEAEPGDPVLRFLEFIRSTPLDRFAAVADSSLDPHEAAELQQWISTSEKTMNRQLFWNRAVGSFVVRPLTWRPSFRNDKPQLPRFDETYSFIEELEFPLIKPKWNGLYVAKDFAVGFAVLVRYGLNLPFNRLELSHFKKSQALEMINETIRSHGAFYYYCELIGIPMMIAQRILEMKMKLEEYEYNAARGDLLFRDLNAYVRGGEYSVDTNDPVLYFKMMDAEVRSLFARHRVSLRPIPSRPRRIPYQSKCSKLNI